MELWAERIFDSLGTLVDLKAEEGVSERFAANPDLERHFARALAILEKMGREPPDLPGSIENKEQAAFILDASMKIISSSRGAKAIWGALGHLEDLGAMLDADIVTHIRDDYQKLASSPVGIPSLIIPWHGTASSQDGGHLIIQPVRDYPEAEVRLLFEELPVSWNETLSRLLVRAFALTSMETGVVRDLVAGLSLGQMSKANNKSVHTVRAQLKSALRKTGASSQADLVRIVSALARYNVDDETLPQIPMQLLLQGKTGVVDLKDGRKIIVHQFGCENGTPVVLVHGMLDSTAFNTMLSEKAARAGLRIIFPVRASFGKSDPIPKGSDCVSLLVDDLGQVLDHLGIDRFVMVGHAGGARFAFAAASAMSQRICGMMVVAGVVPIIDPRQLSFMSRRQRLVATTARLTPKLLPVILRAGIYLMDSGGSDKFMTALYPEGTRDHEFARRPEIKAAIFEGYRFAVAQGYRAFEQDARALAGDWSRDVEQCRVPVVLHHGVHDPAVHISTVRDFANRFSSLKLVEYPDVGQLVFFEQTDKVIASIVELAKEGRATRGSHLRDGMLA